MAGKASVPAAIPPPLVISNRPDVNWLLLTCPGNFVPHSLCELIYFTKARRRRLTGKDENLTKAHVRYLENRLLAEAALINRFTLDQNQAGGSKLPESEREDIAVFLARIRQLLPVLGSDILAPIAQPAAKAQAGGVLYCRINGSVAQGQHTANGLSYSRDPLLCWRSAHPPRGIRTS